MSTTTSLSYTELKHRVKTHPRYSPGNPKLNASKATLCSWLNSQNTLLTPHHFLKANPNGMIVFTASWCNPCKQFKDLLYHKVLKDKHQIQEFVDKMENIQFMFNNNVPLLLVTDVSHDILNEFGVKGFPTLLQFSNGTDSRSVDRNILLSNSANVTLVGAS